MAKWLEFKDYVAKIVDRDGDKHEHTVSAAVVDENTRGEVNTIAGTVQTNPGDVVVKTDNPGVYDVHSADTWKGTGYAGNEAVKDQPAPPNPNPGVNQESQGQ